MRATSSNMVWPTVYAYQACPEAKGLAVRSELAHLDLIHNVAYVFDYLSMAGMDSIAQACGTGNYIMRARLLSTILTGEQSFRT